MVTSLYTGLVSLDAKTFGHVGEAATTHHGSDYRQGQFPLVTILYSYMSYSNDSAP
jgi:hypothetical protein